MENTSISHSSPLRSISRIAPTPSGFLHLGNALSFVYTRLLTDILGGRMHLRIDDLDRERFRVAYLEDIFRVIDWLGLDLDGGPSSPDDFERNFSQHLRLHVYEETLEQLRQQGLLFACACSRKTYLELKGEACPCHTSARGFHATEHAWRWRNRLPEMQVVDLDGKAHSILLQETMPYPVLRQKGGLPAYQIASLCDDHAMGVNILVRGEDLLASSAFQKHLAGALSWKQFSDAATMHHPLLLFRGEKISKSAGSDSFHAWRADGWQPKRFYSKLSEMLTNRQTKPESYTELLDLISGRKDQLFNLFRSHQAGLSDRSK